MKTIFGSIQNLRKSVGGSWQLALVVAAWVLGMNGTVVQADSHGYISDVASERESPAYEIIAPPPPRPDPEQEIPLQELIFNQRVTTDLQNRYFAVFGYSTAEQNVDTPDRFSEIDYGGRIVSFEQDQTLRQQYGEFVMRKLTEHHVDRFLKTNKSVRPVYEFKEKVSKVKVEVRKNYSFNIKYDLVGNALRFDVVNPYDIQTFFEMRMDPQQIGSTTPERYDVVVAYNVSDTWRVTHRMLQNLAARDQPTTVFLTFTKRLARAMSVAATYQRNLDFVNERVGYNERYLLGFNWTY